MEEERVARGGAAGTRPEGAATCAGVAAAGGSCGTAAAAAATWSALGGEIASTTTTTEDMHVCVFVSSERQVRRSTRAIAATPPPSPFLFRDTDRRGRIVLPSMHKEGKKSQ